MEYDYMEYRKDSQAALREKNSRGEKMDGFHSSEKRRKEGREPEKELEIGKFYQVEVVDADDFDLYAKIINDYE